jgi:SnoaL-like domain
MSASPIERLLEAIDRLDGEGVVSMLAPECRLLTADGHRAEGISAARQLMTAFLGALRSTAHEITSQWHVDDVWIAEVEASYQLEDWLELSALPRAFVLREGPNGIEDLRVYGAHEHPLSEHRSGEEGMWVGGRWIPPL